MVFTIVFITYTISVIYFIFKLFSFARNYIAGIRTGFPVYVTPVFMKSIPWLVLGAVFLPLFKIYLPAWAFDRLDITIHGWEFRRKREFHARLGKTFVVVSPDGVQLWSADPALGNVILQRRKDFLQPPIAEKIIGFLGKNVLVSDGEDWQRQRRLIAPNLNERINESVWDEGCRQAQTMIDHLTKHSETSTIQGLRSIAINVLGHVGYGQTQPWTPAFKYDAKELRPESMTYFEAISIVVLNIMEAAFLPPKLMKLSFMPQSLRILGETMENIPRYTKELLDRERQQAKENSHAKNNVLSMLVRLSDQGKSGDQSGLTLSEDEISGNLFVFTAAGFDTTANTMGYAVALLAAYPKYQDWIQEELRSLDTVSLTWRYEDAFAKCQRVLAVMFETLRLFTPLMHSARYIAEPQQITDTEGAHYLSASMEILVCAQAMHCDPSIWGADVLEFNPLRWIDMTSGRLTEPPKGTFLPWSGGPRVCPGMKMAQVEFVAAIATLFRSARCEPVREADETDEEARAKLKEIMNESISKLTLQIRDPKTVKLRWISTV